MELDRLRQLDVIGTVENDVDVKNCLKLDTRLVRDWCFRDSRWRRWARLVAREFRDGDASNAETVPLAIVKMLIVLSLVHKLAIASLDVGDAFLQVPQLTTVLIEIPKWALQQRAHGDGGRFWILKRCLPGQRAAAAEWNKFFIGVCERYNYENFQGTIFKHKEEMSFISIYIDDLLANRTQGLHQWLPQEVVPGTQAGDSRVIGMSLDCGMWRWWKHLLPQAWTYVNFNLLRMEFTWPQVQARYIPKLTEILKIQEEGDRFPIMAACKCLMQETPQWMSFFTKQKQRSSDQALAYVSTSAKRDATPNILSGSLPLTCQGQPGPPWMQSKSWHLTWSIPATWSFSMAQLSFTRQPCRIDMLARWNGRPSPTATVIRLYASSVDEARVLAGSSWMDAWCTATQDPRRRSHWAQWRLRFWLPQICSQRPSTWNKFCSSWLVTMVAWATQRRWQCGWGWIQRAPKPCSHALDLDVPSILSTRLLRTQQAMRRLWFGVARISTKENPADLSTKHISKERREFVMKRIGLVSNTFEGEGEIPLQGNKHKLVKLLVTMVMGSGLQGFITTSTSETSSSES